MEVRPGEGRNGSSLNVKDAERKEHPCCVPYDALPVEQKTKDYLFRAVVHALFR